MKALFLLAASITAFSPGNYSQDLCNYDKYELLFPTHYHPSKGKHPYRYLSLDENGCHYEYYRNPYEAFKHNLASIVVSAKSIVDQKTCLYKIAQTRHGKTYEMYFVWSKPESYILLPLNANCRKTTGQTLWPWLKEYLSKNKLL